MNVIYPVLIALLLMLSLLSGSVQAACNTANLPEATPSTDFTDNGDGTVTHNTTGLMWMRCALGQSGADCATGTATTLNWTQGLTAANNSTFATYTDWRLPNLKELASIVETQCTSPSINEMVFPNTPPSFFWSASGFAGFSDSAWGLGFSDGVGDFDSKDFAIRVRLVRGGQLFDDFDNNRATSTSAITSDNPDPSVVGQAVTVAFTVTSTGGTPTGDVTVTADSGESCTATVAVGSCEIILNTAGDRTLMASYAGDANFNPSVSAAEAHTVILATGGPGGPTAIPAMGLWGLITLGLTLAGMLGWRGRSG